MSTTSPIAGNGKRGCQVMLRIRQRGQPSSGSAANWAEIGMWPGGYWQQQRMVVPVPSVGIRAVHAWADQPVKGRL